MASDAHIELLGLPAELLADIISKTSARDTQAARSVCRHLRNIVDENVLYIAKILEATAIHKQRLNLDRIFSPANEFVQWLEICKTQTTTVTQCEAAAMAFLTLLSRIIKHRGVTQLAKSIEFDVAALATLLDPKFTVAPILFGHPAQVLGRCVHALYRQCHLRSGYHPIYRSQLRHGFTVLLESTGDALGLVSVLGYLFDQVVAGLPDLAQTEPRERWMVADGVESFDKSWDYIPPWPLTPLTPVAACDVSNPYRMIKFNGLCSAARLSTLFGLPLLPTHERRYMGYSARSRWAYDKVRQAVEGDQLDPLVRAAVLEDIIVF